MNSRFNYLFIKKRDRSKDDEFSSFKLIKKINVLSTAKDGSVEKYIETSAWKEEKSSWKDFIKSYDLGSVSDQVINHLTRGTPLITAHVLPSGDYSSIGLGAEVVKEMQSKGITLDMIVQAINESVQVKAQETKVVKEVKEGETK